METLERPRGADLSDVQRACDKANSTRATVERDIAHLVNWKSPTPAGADAGSTAAIVVAGRRDHDTAQVRDLVEQRREPGDLAGSKIQRGQLSDR